MIESGCVYQVEMVVLFFFFVLSLFFGKRGNRTAYEQCVEEVPRSFRRGYLP